jgi:beta-lactamase class A
MPARPSRALVTAAAVLLLGSAMTTRVIVPFAESRGWWGPSPITVTVGAPGAASGASTSGSVTATASARAAAASAQASGQVSAQAAAKEAQASRAASTARAQATFTRTVSAYLRTRSGSVGVVAVDVQAGVVVSSSPEIASYTASIVKLDILAALLLQRQDAGRLPTTAEQTLARSMITESDNDAASALWQRIGGAGGLAKANRRLGLRETVPGAGSLWGLTRTTAADQVRLLTVVTGYGGVLVQAGLAGTADALKAAQRTYAVGLMEQVDDDQAWGVSAAAAGAGTALKNGWLPYSGDGYRWLVNSIGRVRTANGATLLVAVLSRRSPSLAYGIATVEQVSRLAAAAIRSAATG